MKKADEKQMLNESISKELLKRFESFQKGIAPDVSTLSDLCVRYILGKYSVSGDILRFDGQKLCLADRCVANLSLEEFIEKNHDTNEEDIDDIVLFKLYKQLDRAFATVVSCLVNSVAGNSEEQAKVNNVIDIDIYDKIIVKDYTVTEAVDSIKEILLSKSIKGAVISGNSSSGKTVAVAQAVKSLETLGESVIWFDFANVNATTHNIACSLLKADKTSKVNIVFDNAQAKPAEVSDFIHVSRAICEILNIKFCIVLLCWPKAQNLIKNITEAELGCKVASFVCNSKTQIKEIVRASGYNQFEEAILTDSRGDVLVADCIIKYLKNNDGIYPTSNQLFENIYSDCTKCLTLSKECDICLYYISSLGEFEIHVKVNICASTKKR